MGCYEKIRRKIVGYDCLVFFLKLIGVVEISSEEIFIFAKVIIISQFKGKYRKKMSACRPPIHYVSEILSV